jgi:predicted SnoaL-like aldol condensation-catalyzing enzyme
MGSIYFHTVSTGAAGHHKIVEGMEACMNNKELVLAAYRALFQERDVSAVERYWGPMYIQHNPNTPDGIEALKGLPAMMGSDFRWEPGLVIAEDDLVMVQGRYTGMGPKPMIRIDIVRVANGKIVEHWDVVQEEAAESVSGHPMFTPR